MTLYELDVRWRRTGNGLDRRTQATLAGAEHVAETLRSLARDVERDAGLRPTVEAPE